ncbi:hypothetical protein [Pradoshia sp.]
MKKVVAIFIIALAVAASATGGALMAADPGPIAPGGSPVIDR